VSQGRRLRPPEQYVALVVVRPSTYDDGVRGCAGLVYIYQKMPPWWLYKSRG
jgi:hypothetical protein